MSTKTRTRPSAPPPSDSSGRSFPLWIPIAAVAVIVAVVVVFIVASGGDDGDSSSVDAGDAGGAEKVAFGEVEVSGEALPPNDGSTPAAGMMMPGIRGVDPTGTELVFRNGEPRAVALLAHWCGHCQNELDEINDWLGDGNDFPEGVQIQGVSTWADGDRPNFPPGDWLNDNDWDHPTIVDDENSTVANTLGLTGTPMWVFVNADGTIAARTGALSPDQLAAQMQALS